MKKVISLFLVFAFVFGIAACEIGGGAFDGDATETETTETETGNVTYPNADNRIAIITNTVDQNEEEYRSAEEIIAQYGEDLVVHYTWPVNFMQESEQMSSIVQKIASDQTIKILVINQAVPGTNPAVDKLLETRQDMFISYCLPQENPPDVVERAQLVIHSNDLKMGETMPVQAQKLGAKVFVHYSFPRHMSQVLLSTRRDLLEKKCAEIGLKFVDATSLDPTAEGTTASQQFILEDVPKKVKEYGKDTAFFSTNCAQQIPLIMACVKAHAIYPQPCDPSPFHGFPAALGIEASNDKAADDPMLTQAEKQALKAKVSDPAYVIAETTRILSAKGVLRRFSTWPIPAAMSFTHTSVSYGLKWLNNEVPREHGKLDVSVLKQGIADYANIEDVESIEMIPYTDEQNNTYDNFLLVMFDYYTYGE